MLLILLSVYFSKETPFAFVLGTSCSGKSDAIVNNFAHARHARTYAHTYARTRAPSNSDVVFLLSQVSHKEQKWEDKLAKIQEKEGRKTIVFSVANHEFRRHEYTNC